MKKYISLLVILFTASCLSAPPTSGQWSFSKARSDGKGFDLVGVTGVNSYNFGLDSSGNLVMNAPGSSAAAAAAGTLTGTTLASNVVTSSLTALGTINTGIWNGTAVADSYIASAATWNAKEAALTFSTGLTRSTNTITVNTSQNIATLNNLTTNGFVKTSGGDGTLSIDTSTYLTTASTINATTVTTNANLTGPVTSVGNATAIANGAISNAMLANGAVANLSGTNTGDQSLAAYLLSATAASTYAPIDGAALTQASINGIGLSESNGSFLNITPGTTVSITGPLGTAAFADYGTDELQLLRWATAANTDPPAAILTATALGAVKRSVTQLPVNLGGTNATTATAARNNLLPSQTDHSNHFLRSDGNNVSWDLISLGDSVQGFLPEASMPALTGDVTTTAGAVATTIATGAVTNSMLAGSIDLTTKVTGTLSVANGGTGAATTANARIALLPSMVGNGGKFLRVNAGATDYDLATIGGGGDALVSGTLDQFADVTQTATKTLAITESTTLAGGSHSGTNTGDQTTITGNAGTATALQTARTINGTSFDGTANITITAAAGTLTGSTLASGVTASSLTSAAGGSFGTAAFTAAAAYEVPLTFGTGLTRTTNTITVNTSQSLTTLSNLTSNGFVKTSGGTGALSIDTATYQVSDADLDDLADGSLTGTLVAAGSTSARGSVELATDGETASSVAVQGNDTRLVNAGKVEIGAAISDETTAITTGTAKLTFRMPHAMTVTAVRLSLTTVSSSGLPTVDINEAGTTILSTKLTCDASEKTSTTAATPAVISDSALADDAEITIDIDTAGTGATGAKVWLIGTR